jgi:hypothetical protein
MIWRDKVTLLFDPIWIVFYIAVIAYLARRGQVFWVVVASVSLVIMTACTVQDYAIAWVHLHPGAPCK